MFHVMLTKLRVITDPCFHRLRGVCPLESNSRRGPELEGEFCLRMYRTYTFTLLTDPEGPVRSNMMMMMMMMTRWSSLTDLGLSEMSRFSCTCIKLMLLWMLDRQSMKGSSPSCHAGWVSRHFRLFYMHTGPPGYESTLIPLIFQSADFNEIL